MPTPDSQLPRSQPRMVKDQPGCIKYILLFFLILLLLAEIYAGEFRRFPDWSWVTWVILWIKLILIAVLIWLIKVQRQLNCALTEPNGCAIAEYDAALHKWVIRVKGTASGAVFGNYVLSVTRGGFAFPMPVIYPGGAASGVAPVINGELGLLDVTGIPSDAYAVKLTVNPSGAGSPCIRENPFDILRKTVSITAIGGVPAQVTEPHPDDPTEPLKLVKASPGPVAPDSPEASVGGSVSVWGTADYYGCGRQMSEYRLEQKQVDFGNNPWQQDVPDPWGGVGINAPLPFGDADHPRVYDSFWGQIDNVVRMPNFLTRFWALSVPVLQAIFPSVIYDPKNVTQSRSWNTGTEGAPSPPALNGRYTVRVRVQHQPLIGPPAPTPPSLYDTATVWIDNRAIEGRITGMAIAGGAPLGACDELLMSMFVTPNPVPFPMPPPAPGSFTKVNAEINGRAWDPLILNSYLAGPQRPNDNFGSYTLDYKKDGDASFVVPPLVPTPVGTPPPLVVTGENRVPNILQEAPLAAYPADTGLLYSWDIIRSLDAGPRPSPYVPPTSPQIYRGERCAYLIVLQVKDTTIVGDGGSTHYIRHDWPFCIMNDLPDELDFPVPPPP